MAGLLSALILAGCAAAPDAPDAADDVPDGLAVSDTLGAIVGLVVDERIVPVKDATVALSGGDVRRNATTDDEGGFVFDSLPPGTYLLEVGSLLHQSTQSSVEVVAGEPDRITKVQLQRLFTTDPYHETLKFEGFIQCGYSISGVMSSLCVNDYTHFVGPYTCEDCEHLVDRRSHDFALGPGWQTMVYEMIWDPSAQGTSPEMRLIVSFFPRDASHAFCSVAGPEPILIRAEVGEECAGNQGGDPELVPPEGMPNMHMFAATDAPDGQPASAAVSQSFTVFMNFFYYGKPPEGWSFVNGDEFPF